MKAREIMTEGAECIHEDQTLVDAARKMADLDVGALPICGRDDRLKGMLTDRDIVVKALAKGRDAATVLVSSLAQGKPVTIGADDSVEEAIDTMSKNEVRRLPVIDGRRLVGMISQADIARKAPKAKTGKLVQDISQDGPSSRLGVRGLGRMLLLALPLAGLGLLFTRLRSGSAGTIEATTEVAVPIRTAYDQWTQFEEFPKFMEGIEEVRQLDDTRLHWVAEIGGKRREWDAKIIDQVPDSRVAWQALDGQNPGGVVTFQRLGDSRTQVRVHMDYEPTGLLETVGSALGLDQRKVKVDLERFKELIEARGTESGAWRGTIQNGGTSGTSAS
jgi:CBS domain-containing protein/uncharacterized protein YndB with AHSA1/START domain